MVGQLSFAHLAVLINTLCGPDLMLLLDDLETFAKSSQDPVALASIKDTRAGLDKLISKMEGLEANFDRIAERSRRFFKNLFLMIIRLIKCMKCCRRLDCLLIDGDVSNIPVLISTEYRIADMFSWQLSCGR